MTKIVLDPDFEYLRPYIDGIPVGFSHRGNLLEARRNIIREDKVQGIHLVIKSYKKIYLTNKIRYSFFSPSKAQRGYDNARILVNSGFNTPRPIAYVEVTRLGIIVESYFVSEYSGLTSLRQITETTEGGPSKHLMLDLAGFTFALHQRGIYHVDYNLGNILVAQQDNKYVFSLIDNNRMDFGPVPLKKGIKNMVKLGLRPEQLTWMVEEYARLRRIDEMKGLSTFFQLKSSELRKRQMKRTLKEFLGVMKSMTGLTAFASEEFSNGLIIAIDALTV